MSGVVGGLQLFLLTAALFTVSLAVVAALVSPWLRARLRRVAPAPRARILTALAVAPLVGGVGLAVLCFVPGVLGQLWPALDHCLSHAHEASMHLCFGHLPVGTGSVVGWALAGLFVVWLTGPTARRALRARASRQALRQLVATAHHDRERDVLVVDARQPIAVVSALTTDVLVSSGLITTLPAALLDAVVAHERAHLDRGDPRRRRLASLLSAAHLPHTRKALLADLELASEQACDEAAASALGDRVRVARALLAVERLATPKGHGLGCAAHGFGDAHVVARVEALLAPPAAEAPRWPRGLSIAVALTVLALVDPLHHAAEHLITLLP